MSEMVDPMRGMTEIVEWLRRTIEGDKRAALKGYGHAWEVEPANRHHVRVRAAEDVEGAVGVLVAMVVGGEAEHVAVHDPRDTIARCEAELALLDRCEFVINANEIRDRDERGHYVTNPIARKLARDTIRMLAFGYRRRDGWKDEWAG